MNFDFTPEQEAFRAEVVEFLADWRDLDAFFLQGRKWPEVARLFRAMGERGWLSLGWPKQAGGAGLPLAFEYILWDEVAYARAARNPARLRHRREDDRALRHAGAAAALAAADPRAARSTSRSATPSRRPARTSRACAAAPSGAATSTS